MPQNPDNLTIAAFAKVCGVHIETVRFYQQKGLLRTPDRPAGRIRRYGPAAVARIRFIKSAQRLGFSLDEIARLLRLDDGVHCREASELAEHHLADVQAKLADLKRMEAVLTKLIRRCKVDRGQLRCPLIASLDAAESRAT